MDVEIDDAVVVDNSEDELSEFVVSLFGDGVGTTACVGAAAFLFVVELLQFSIVVFTDGVFFTVFGAALCCKSDVSDKPLAIFSWYCCLLRSLSCINFSQALLSRRFLAHVSPRT